MSHYTLYVHITPNNKYYIGITGRSVVERWGYNGWGYYDERRKYQLPFCNAIKKYGWDNIRHIILLENLSKEMACECEKYLIAKFQTTNSKYGYNLVNGGEGVDGYKHTEETRLLLHQKLAGRKLSDEHKQKISKALMGRPNTWQKGVPVSEESKQKMSEALKGHATSEETRKKISIANTGHNPNTDTRKKMSENNCMHRPEIRKKVSETLKLTQEERTRKRLHTMKERYPDGIKQSEESNRKRSEALKGKPKSEETKQKMRKPKSPQAIENMKKAQIEAWKRRKSQERIGGN